MDIKRLYYSIRYVLYFNQAKRAEYAKHHHLFYHIGDNVRLPASLVPLHSELISLHNNIEIASGVKFVVHDAIHGVLNFKYHNVKDHEEFPELLDCIEIMDNVFVGANTIILGGVRIGPNVIVGANSLVTKDLPEGTVCAGIPAKPIGTFDDIVKKRRKIQPFVSKETAWEEFLSKRQ